MFCMSMIVFLRLREIEHRQTRRTEEEEEKCTTFIFLSFFISLLPILIAIVISLLRENETKNDSYTAATHK